jgi:hypothetical protein
MQLKAAMKKLAETISIDELPPFENVVRFKPQTDPNIAPEFETVFDATEPSTPRVAPGTSAEGAGAGRLPPVPIGPEDPLAHMPRRVEPVKGKK